MDQTKNGRLLAALRKEAGMTQAQAAQALGVSPQAVSKWERGLGSPDVALLPKLGALYRADLNRLLEGDLAPNEKIGGNMKRIRFYRCPACANLLTSTGGAGVSCCGRTLEPLVPQPADEAHALSVAPVEDELYCQADHPMTKEHYISFMAYVGDDRMTFVKLYPEQSPAARFPRARDGVFYYCCSRDGLFFQKLRG